MYEGVQLFLLVAQSIPNVCSTFTFLWVILTRILLIFRFEKSVNIFFGYSNFGFMLRKAKAVFANFNFFSLFYDFI